jgi:protein phosphatase
MSIAHVGDSRLYAISAAGEMSAITRDHSLVMRMMELGQLSEQDAAIHPQRNVLYRALGQGEAFSPDITTSPLPESGSLLLCSDGLWGVVPAAEISRLIRDNADPRVAAQLLINAANAAGGPDNISAILIHLPE